MRRHYFLKTSTTNHLKSALHCSLYVFIVIGPITFVPISCHYSFDTSKLINPLFPCNDLDLVCVRYTLRNKDYLIVRIRTSNLSNPVEVLFRQGCSFFPLKFNIYVNDIITKRALANPNGTDLWKGFYLNVLIYTDNLVSNYLRQ